MLLNGAALIEETAVQLQVATYISQNMERFIITAVGTSDPTYM
jgi:hypothetical protein